MKCKQLFSGIVFLLLLFVMSCSTAGYVVDEEYNDDFSSIKADVVPKIEAASDINNVFAGRALTNDYILQQAEMGVIVPSEEILTNAYFASVDYNYPEFENNPEVSFTNTSYNISRWAKEGWIQIGLKAKELPFTKFPPLNVVFVVDTSSSMEDAKNLAWVKQALSDFVAKIRNGDSLSIVSFNDTARVLLKSTVITGEQSRNEFLLALKNLKTGGETNIEAGLSLGYEQAVAGFRKNAVNIVLLLSDGTKFSSRLSQAFARSGDVRVSLIWDNRNDLDLTVETPKKEIISFVKPTDSQGGMLDVDINIGGEKSHPMESVFWPRGKAPRGVYNVYVSNYHLHETASEPTNFNVEIKSGNSYRRFEGSFDGLQGEDTIKVCSFQFGNSDEKKDTIYQIAEKHRKDNIFVSLLGIGSNVDVELMRLLAEEGYGSARLIDKDDTTILGTDAGFGRIAVKTIRNLEMVVEFPIDTEIAEIWGRPYRINNNLVYFNIPFIHAGDYETILIRYRFHTPNPGTAKYISLLGKGFDNKQNEFTFPEKKIRVYHDTNNALLEDVNSSEMFLHAKTVLNFLNGIKDIANLYYSSDKSVPVFKRLVPVRAKTSELKTELEKVKPLLSQANALEHELAILSAYIVTLDNEMGGYNLYKKRKPTNSKSNFVNRNVPSESKVAPPESKVRPSEEETYDFDITENAKVYRVQVGSFLKIENAEVVVERLRKIGLNPEIEFFGDYKRVIIRNVKAQELEELSNRVNAAGFKAMWIRN